MAIQYSRAGRAGERAGYTHGNECDGIDQLGRVGDAYVQQEHRQSSDVEGPDVGRWSSSRRRGGSVVCERQWYDPQPGRFIQEDPIGVDGGVNVYLYAGEEWKNGVLPRARTAQDQTPYLPRFVQRWHTCRPARLWT